MKSFFSHAFHTFGKTASSKRRLSHNFSTVSCIEMLEDRLLLSALTVENLNDGGAGSLRQAVEDANDLAGTDVIEFARGLKGTISLSSGQLTITDDLTIDGPGARKLTISGNNASRVVNVAETDVTIEGLTIANGFSTGSEALGGGILNTGGILTVIDVTFSNNQASGTGTPTAVAGGGAVANVLGGVLTVTGSTFTGNSASAPTRGTGGAILNDAGSTLTVDASAFTGNIATGLYLDHNRVYGGDGGAIANLGNSTATVRQTEFIANQARGLDGKDTPGRIGGSASGGAIFNSFRSLVRAGHVNQGPDLIIENSTFLENQALGGDGGDTDGGVSVGSGGFGSGGVLVNDNGGTTTIRDSLLQGNLARGGAGGDSFNTAPGGRGGNAIGGTILTLRAQLTVERTTFADNQAIAGRGGSSLAVGGNGANARGGVLHVIGYTGLVGPGPIALPSVLTFVDVTFQGNRVVGGAGGDGGSGQGGKGGFARGGALSTNETTLNIYDSLLDGNQAIGGNGGAGGTIGNGGNGYGGAISNGNEFADPGKVANFLTVIDSTLTNNRALGGTGTVAGSGFGGAVMNGANATATISNTTITNNHAIGGDGIFTGGNGSGGAIFNQTYASLTLLDSTVTDNEAIGGTGGDEEGEGIGGGIYSSPGGTVSADLLTLIDANFASTSDDDLFGMLNLI
jgi:hypothetical protein